MADGLTPRQRRFVEEYLIDFNATQAAIRAGYAAKDADVQGPRVLGYAGVAAAIAEGREKIAERALVTAADVLQGLRREATLEGEGSSHSARVAAWAKLGEHLKMFTQKHEHAGEIRNRVISGEPLDLATWAAKYETPEETAH